MSQKPKWVMHVQLTDGRYGRVKELTEGNRDMLIKCDEDEKFETVPVEEIKYVLKEREWLKRYSKDRARRKGVIMQ